MIPMKTKMKAIHILQSIFLPRNYCTTYTVKHSESVSQPTLQDVDNT
jgi:hypothetical protein